MSGSKELKILAYPGDGIGLEVIPEGVRAIAALAEGLAGTKDAFAVRWTDVDWGMAHHRRTGKVIPDDFIPQIKAHDAVFLGAVGDPRYLPDHILDQYVCLRPAKLLEGVRSPLATSKPIDIVVVRENSEGEYASNGGLFKPRTPDEVAIETAVHTRKGVERICRYAFELSRTRSRHVTLATKSNALKNAMVMWDRVFAEIAHDYPDVRADKCHVDALSMDFVRKPETLDVVVGSNLFGDILSDLGGAISGSLGLAPSANINPERKFPSMFEPVHGSAVDIAGKGIANPIGTLRAAAMMLGFLNQPRAAAILDKAIAANLAAGQIRTADIGGHHKMSHVTDDIIRRFDF